MLLLLSIAVVAGCGGSAEPAAKKSGRAELVADARAICARMENRLPDVGGRPQSLSGQELVRVAGAWRATIDELRALRPPPEEATRFGRMLTHFDNAARALEASAGANDEAILVAIAGMAYEGQKGAAIARAYGLEECSLVPPGPTQQEFERWVLSEAAEHDPLAKPPRGRLGPDTKR